MQILKGLLIIYEVREMIIYHTITTYHLIQAWVHGLLYHFEENRILLYDDVMEEKFNALQYLEKMGIFSKVISIPYRKSPRKIEDLEMWIESTFSTLELEWEHVDKIYVAGGQFYFSEWLIGKKVPFIFCEEASGRLSKPEVVMENDQVLNMLRYEIALKNGMYTGDNELVTNKIYNAKAQIEGYVDEKAIDFDVVEGIERLSKQHQKQILEFFNAPVNLSINQKSVVILTQHFTNLKMMSLKEQEELYQQTIDYYLADYYPIIKVHPDDQIYYSQMIKRCMVIDTKFPSELIPYIFTSKPDMIATISSTGIYSFLDNFKKSLNFNPDYEKNYVKNHRFYLISEIVKLVSGGNKISIGYQGESFVQFENMLHVSDLLAENIIYEQQGQIQIIDNIYDDLINENSVYIFVDAAKQLYLSDWMKNNQSNIIAKKIYVFKGKRLFKEEVVLIYCPNLKNREVVCNMSYIKKLENSDLEIAVMEESELENKILVLEAILKATEERLLFELKQKNSSIEEK